ncbi:recombinase family protein [Candidatus Roizmanbacteria bacterium]|nr:recombinase family protein [Candidatus Roizmanbacteria bacterium]
MTNSNISKAKNAIIYARVSTEEQVDNFSLNTQVELCENEARKQNYKVIKIFREEGRSAKTISGRPTLLELIQFCNKNRKKVNAVFIYRIDRLSRNAFDYWTIKNKLLSFGVQVVSTAEPIGTSPVEVFMESTFASMAQMDNAIRGERAHNGMKARLLAGYCNSSAPLGYIKQNKLAEKDPKTFHLVKLAWDLFASGMLSINEIVDILNEKGLRTKYNQAIKCRTLYKLFSNKFYMGVLVSKANNLEAKGQHIPMVSRRQFFQVQELIHWKDHNKIAEATRIQNNIDFPYKRNLLCGKCGAHLTASWSKGRHTRVPYYRCARGCTGKSVNARLIHKLMDEIAASTSISSTDTFKLTHMFKKYKKDITEDVRSKLLGISGKMTLLNNEKQLTVRRNLDGVFSDEIYKEQIELIDKQLALLTEERRKITLYKTDSNKINREFEILTESFPLTFKMAHPAQRKALIEFCYPEGFVWDYQGSLIRSSDNTRQKNEEMYALVLQVFLDIIDSQLLPTSISREEYLSP